NTSNIEILFNTEVKEIIGDDIKVTGARVFNKNTDKETKLDIAGLFIAIGHLPNTAIFNPWITMDDIGYIKTINCTTKTNVSGVFCCGDAQDPSYRQAITAAGSGCMASLDCERFLSAIEHGVFE